MLAARAAQGGVTVADIITLITVLTTSIVTIITVIQVGRTRTDVKSIDKAVNSTPAGWPSIQQNVRTLLDERDVANGFTPPAGEPPKPKPKPKGKPKR